MNDTQTPSHHIEEEAATALPKSSKIAPMSFFRILWLLGRVIKKKKVGNLAQSIAFASIFSSVPILAVFFFIMSKLTQNADAQTKIQEFVSQYLIPEYITPIFTELQQLSQESVTLGVIGIPTLLLAGIMLYAKVDSAINEIWETTLERKWFRNSFAFFMTIFFGPMLLVLLLSIPPYFETLPFYTELEQTVVFQFIVTQIIPYLIISIGLGVLYFYIPNIRVKPIYAFNGALMAAFWVQISNQLISYYLTNLAKLDLLYGSLVTLPLILIWVYVLWLVVLAGAALVFVLQQHEATNYKIQDNNYSDESFLHNAVEILLLLAQTFEREEASLDIEQISYRLSMHRKRLHHIIQVLQDNSLVTMLEPDSHKQAGHIRYQLGRAAKAIHLSSLVPLFYSEKRHECFTPTHGELLNRLAAHPLLLKNYTLEDLKEHPERMIK